MKLAIMQPYFLPYIGYFQLIDAVDEFVVYDNIQFSKGGWIQRNRILMNGSDYIFSLPIKKDSDYLDIYDRWLADSFVDHRDKTLRRIESAYRKAPYFAVGMKLANECFNHPETNLFRFIYNSLCIVCDFLKIETKIIVSSAIKMDHGLKGQDRVIRTCEVLSADHYVNAIGGKSLYSKRSFAEKGIVLSFIRSHEITYQQLENEFLPALSIIDVIMFNPVVRIREYLTMYELE